VLPERGQRMATRNTTFPSSDRTPRVPRYTHTWATFVKATGEGPDHSKYQIETFTISWLPASLEVRSFRLAEPGVNFDLYATFDFVLSQGQRISEWGPFQIPRVFYERALERKALLESGVIRYHYRVLLDCLRCCLCLARTKDAPFLPQWQRCQKMPSPVLPQARSE
jgi:hypothetical protein